MQYLHNVNMISIIQLNWAANMHTHDGKVMHKCGLQAYSVNCWLQFEFSEMEKTSSCILPGTGGESVQTPPDGGVGETLYF